MRIIDAPIVPRIKEVYRDLQKLNAVNGGRFDFYLGIVDFTGNEMMASREFYDRYGGFRDLGGALSNYFRDLQNARDSVAS